MRLWLAAALEQDEDAPTPTLEAARTAFVTRYLREQLIEHAGSVRHVAIACGIDRTHAYKLIGTLGLNPNDYRNKHAGGKDVGVRVAP